jgi:competence protein ComEC
MLLTGIESRPKWAAETRSVGSSMLLVPHHGSRTSSSADFLAAVHPSIAVVPVGYRNRFGHPNAEVLERYRDSGTRVWRTDQEGAVTVYLSKEKFEIKSQRRESMRYWHDAPR